MDSSVSQITEYIKKEILPAVPAQLDQFSVQNVEILRNRLHVLHYYCIQKGFNSGLIGRIESVLETSQIFWDLLEENANTFTDLKEAGKVRKLDLGSNLMNQIEEIISGEESFRDVIMTTIGTFLGWKADSIWVDMSVRGRVNFSKALIVSLRDELWRFVKDSSPNGSEITLEKAAEIGEKMGLLMQFIAGEDVPVAARIMFISQIYSLLLRLSIIKILINLQANPEKT